MDSDEKNKKEDNEEEISNKEKIESKKDIDEEELDSKDIEISDLKEKLEKSEKKNNEYISHIQRLQADFENFKKHTEKRNVEIIKFANENLILNLLESYEDLKRAVENEDSENLKEGLKLIYSKLKNTLEKEGLKEIPTEGEKFDPFKHEALMAEAKDDVENGYIIDELMKGYTYNDKVIKYSKVRVCKK